jgi:hypothetical protein
MEDSPILTHGSATKVYTIQNVYNIQNFYMTENISKKRRSDNSRRLPQIYEPPKS